MTKMILTAVIAVFALSSAPAFAGNGNGPGQGDDSCVGNCPTGGGGMTTAEANAASLAAAQAVNDSFNTINRYDQRTVTNKYDQRTVTNVTDKSVTATGGAGGDASNYNYSPSAATSISGGGTGVGIGTGGSVGDTTASATGGSATANGGAATATASNQGNTVSGGDQQNQVTVDGDSFLWKYKVAAAQAAPIIGDSSNPCSLIRGLSGQAIAAGGAFRWDSEGKKCPEWLVTNQAEQATALTQDPWWACAHKAMWLNQRVVEKALDGAVPFDWNACMGIAAPTKPFVATGHQALPLAAVTKAAVKADRDFAPEGAGDRG